MRLESESYSIDELIERIEDGRLALPEFQRDFKWRPKEIAELVRTLARRWPMGTFLLLEIGDKLPFAIRPLEDAPNPTDPSRVILDGQQRTTAIFHAFREHQGGETYFFHLGRIAQNEEFSDDDLEYLKSSKFKKEYPNLKAMATGGIAPVTVLTDPRDWQKWLNHLDVEDREVMVEVREELLPGFTAYDVPAHRLEEGSDLAAVAKIFETINRTGKRLAVFDLMVARLYPKDFYLKFEWEKVRAANDVLADFTDEDDGIEILKVIALREHLRQRELGKSYTDKRVKGVVESDVLDIDRDVVIQEWPLAAKAYANALAFVRDRCGAIRESLLPAPAMLLALSDALHPSSDRREDLEKDLERWFWAATFKQEYSQSANSQAVRDTPELRAWQADPAAVPEALRHFEMSLDPLLEGRRRNDVLIRGLLCLSVTEDARDWIKDERFSDLSDPLEWHHIIPADFLTDHYEGEADPVSNFALLTKSSNAALRDKTPREVLIDKDVKTAAIDSHIAIDRKLLEKDPAKNPKKYVEEILEQRANDLKEGIVEKVGA